MLKTNNTCQITNLAQDMDVAKMAEELENVDQEVNESNTTTTYVLKSRMKRYGKQARQELLPEVQDHCRNEPIVETEDFSVNKTEFENYDAGGIIFVESTAKTRTCVTIHACTGKGPGACSYRGFRNPVDNRAFSFHHISSGSICVNCTIDRPGGASCDDKDLCPCSSIRDKNSLFDCRKKKTFLYKINSNTLILFQAGIQQL